MQQKRFSSSLLKSTRSRLVALALLAGLLVLACYGIRAIAFDAWLRSARSALERGDFEHAGARLAQCLARSPHDPDALLLSARLERRQGNLDEADRHLRTYDANYGRDEPYTFERMLLRVLKYGPGLDDDRSLREHVDRNNSQRASQAIDVFETLTLGYRQVMQATATLHCANELLEVDPDHVRGLVARGWALEQFNRMNEALADYEKAARLDPANVEARLSLGELLLNFNRPAEAVEHFQWLNEQEPDNVAVGYGLARCREALDDLDDAARILDRLLERYETHPLLLELRGHVAWLQKKPTEAVGFLQEAVERAPYLRQANHDLSQCLLRQGLTAEASKCQKQVDSIDADTKRLGELYKILSRPEGTAAQCLEAAEVALRLGKEEAAMSWLESALRKEPTLPAAHALIADVYERHGDRPRAEFHRRQAQRK
jgi:tetratricopeptide (TPR) repeat protein